MKVSQRRGEKSACGGRVSLWGKHVGRVVLVNAAQADGGICWDTEQGAARGLSALRLQGADKPFTGIESPSHFPLPFTTPPSLSPCPSHPPPPSLPPSPLRLPLPPPPPSSPLPHRAWRHQGPS